MYESDNIPIELLPVGYCKLEVIKTSFLEEYSYRILISNKIFKQMTFNKTYDSKLESYICEDLESALFNQNKLQEYHNIAINSSFMEFHQNCKLHDKYLIVKLKSISKNTLSMVIVPATPDGLHYIKNEPITDYEKILDNSLDHLMILDINLNYKFCNHETKLFLNLDEYKKDTLNCMKFIHPEDQQLALDVIDDLLKDPAKVFSSKIRILRHDKEYRLMSFRAKNMLQSPGINGIVINAQDITSQEANKQKIIEKEQYLESLFEAIPNLIFVLDYEGFFLDFKSSSSNDDLAFPPEHFLGKNLSSLFPEYLSKKLVSAIQQLKTEQTVEAVSYQYKNHHERTGHYECHFSKIDDKKVLAVINDVTALKKIEEVLKNNQKLIQKKLDAIIQPEGNLNRLDLADLIDIEELKYLFTTINEFTKIPVTLLDKDGGIVFSVGMSQMCEKFLLNNTKPALKCSDYNFVNIKDLKRGESKLFKCPNNLWNYVYPIFVGDEQIASLNICQFRLTEDEQGYDKFIQQQASNDHFDKEEALSTYHLLPIINKEQLIKVGTYYHNLLNKITALSYAQIKQARTTTQLKLRDDKLTQITDNMTDVIFVLDFDQNISYVSPSVEKVYGFTPEEYKKRTLEEKFPKASSQKIKDTIMKGLKVPNKGSRNVIFDFQEYHANGNLIDISMHGKILRDSNQNPLGIIGSARDITDKKNIETELNKQLQLHSLLSSIAMNYINIPLDKIKDSLNDSLKEFAQFANSDRAYIFKYDWDKNTTSNTFEWCKEGIQPEIDNLQDIPINLMKDWNEKLRAGKTIIVEDVEGVPESVEGKSLLLQQNIKSLIFVPLMDNELCLGFIGFDSVLKKHHFNQTDITILKIFSNLIVNINNRIVIAEELTKEKVRATQSDKLKSNLLWNISHEFRTPLNGVIGLSELLQNKPIKPEYQKIAELIYISGIRLNNVLDSIMLYSQLDSHTDSEVITLQKNNLSNLVANLTEQYRAQIDQKGLDLIVAIQSNVFVDINESLFTQAITHLVNNAIKYTNKGFIKISLSTNQKTKKAKLSIEDSGIGIQSNLQNMVFTDFKQLSEGYNRAYEGCGLGLPIAKKAIELMKGEIILESELKKGSIFTIVLTENRDTTKEDTVKADIDLSPVSEVSPNNLDEEKQSLPAVLIVEDNRVNQKLATLILKKSYQTDSAYNGESAIKMIAEKQYDVILMDINLGEGLDGIEITKIIRNDIRYKNTPIIAVTGYTKIGDKEHILNQGFNSYLGKPYSAKQLLCIVEESLMEKIN